MSILIGGVGTLACLLTALLLFLVGGYLGVTLVHKALEDKYRRRYEYKVQMMNDPAHTVYYTPRAYKLAETETAMKEGRYDGKAEDPLR